MHMQGAWDYAYIKEDAFVSLRGLTRMALT